LTIVSEAANFAGNMPTTGMIGRSSLILSERGMIKYINEVRRMIETGTGGQ
jgi:hypothetical protein